MLASNAATQMGASAGKLVSAADQVSNEVRENTIAAGQMSVHVQEVTTEALTLAGMASALQEVVSQFKLVAQG